MGHLLGSKGLTGYIDGQIPKPTPSRSTTSDAQAATATPIYSSKPSLDEWNFRDQLAKGHIVLNCVDIESLGINTSGTAKETWESIQTEWGKSTDMRRSHAQEALNQTKYVEGTSIQDHIKALRTKKAALDNLCTSTMSDETWRGILIRSIPPTAKWLPVIPSLYTMSSSADIVSMLLAHGMILGIDTKSTSSGSSSTALAARMTDSCTNPNCKAKKRSTHTTLNCYWPGGGKEGQFPPNFGQRSKANATTSSTTSSTTPATSTTSTTPAKPASNTSTSGQADHFVLSARVPSTPGRSGVLVGDPITYPPMAFVSLGFQSFDNGRVPTGPLKVTQNA